MNYEVICPGCENSEIEIDNTNGGQFIDSSVKCGVCHLEGNLSEFLMPVIDEIVFEPDFVVGGH